MTDDGGNRVLVSFGQWSPKVTKNDSRIRINTAINSAKGIAYDNAVSYMTMFVNTTLALENKTKLSASETINILSHTDGASEEQQNSSVGAMLDRFVKENSRVSIEGISEVNSWMNKNNKTIKNQDIQRYNDNQGNYKVYRSKDLNNN